MNARGVLGGVALCAAAASGCATVVSGRTADVAVHSVPPEASVTVRDAEGAVVANTVTPGTVTLRRGRSWMRPARYEATFEKPGYEPTVAPIETTFNPWSLANIVAGGGIGIGVDAVTGAMWKPKASAVETTLARVDGEYPSGGSPNLGPPQMTGVRTASATAPVENR